MVTAEQTIDVGLVTRRVIRERIARRLKFNLHDHQKAVCKALDNGAKVVAINAGSRGGKTILAGLLAQTEAAFGPDGMQPVRTIPIIAPYKELTDKCFRMIWQSIINKKSYAAIVKKGKAYMPVEKSKRERYIEMPWGARIVGLSADNPTSLLAEGWPLVIMDEFSRVKEGVYEEFVERALMDVGGVVVFITTPRGSNHWRKRYEEVALLAETDPRYFAITWTSYDNPGIDHEALDITRAYYERAGSMDIFNMNFMADFTALAGSVYPMFSPTKNGKPWHIQHIQPNDEQGFVLGIDWGFRNPFVCLFAQIHGDCLYIYDEIYKPGMTDEECIENVLTVMRTLTSNRSSASPQGYINCAYADPSAPEAIEAFVRAGISMFDDDKIKLNAVNYGIASVRSLLYREDKPGVVIDPKCTNLINEFDNYSFNEKTENEKPIKLKDHAMDGIRYLAVGAIAMETEPWLLII